jgi:hypothetical protein
MKTKISLIAGLALAVSAITLAAQTPATQPPLHSTTRGPGWRLTPEQQAQRHVQVQTALNDLRTKRDSGTLTADEKARLEGMEQAGGLCINGVPRGGGRGRGAGFGPRDGTGPRAQDGTCPLVKHSAAVTPAPGSGRGPGFGMGYRGGRGRGQGGGHLPVSEHADGKVNGASDTSKTRNGLRVETIF